MIYLECFPTGIYIEPGGINPKEWKPSAATIYKSCWPDCLVSLHIGFSLNHG